MKVAKFLLFHVRISSPHSWWAQNNSDVDRWLVIFCCACAHFVRGEFWTSGCKIYSGFIFFEVYPWFFQHSTSLILSSYVLHALNFQIHWLWLLLRRIFILCETEFFSSQKSLITVLLTVSWSCDLIIALFWWWRLLYGCRCASIAMQRIPHGLLLRMEC